MAGDRDERDEGQRRRAASNIRMAVMLGIIVLLLYISFILLNG